MPARRPKVLIDLDESEIATIRDRLLELQARENLSCVDVAALCHLSPSVVRTFLCAKARASDDTLRALIAAFVELSADLTVEIRPR